MSEMPSNKSMPTIFAGKTPSWVWGFCLHVVAGLIATAAHYTAMFILIHAGMTEIVASTLGFTVGAATRFILSYFHVFSPTAGVKKAMLRFLFALLVQMVANSLLLGILMRAGLPVWTAQVATTMALTIFTYIGSRLWVFR